MDLTLLRAGRMIPSFAADHESGVVEDGALVVEGSRVLHVGTFAELHKQFPAAPVIGESRHLLIPGLANSHHHGYGVAGFSLGCRDDALEVWVPDPLRRRPIDLYLDTLYSDARLLRSGVTTVLHQGYARGGLASDAAHRSALEAHDRAGVRVAYAVGHQDSNPLLYGDANAFVDGLPAEAAACIAPWLAENRAVPPVDYFDLLRGLCAQYQGHERVKILAGPEGPEWCSPVLLGGVADVARELDIGIHLHVLESPMQRELSSRYGGENTVAAIERLGLLGPRTSIAHAAWFNDDDMRACADHDASVVHNPSSNLRLRNGIAPVTRMLALGVNVALGCDSTALNCDDDLLQEARLASYLHRAPSPSALSPCPSARDVLKMATANAGAPTGYGNSIGTLEAGSYADAVLIDYQALSAPYLEPGLDPAEVLLTLGNNRHVDTVMVGGEVVVRDGRHVSLNESEICEQLAESIQDQPVLREVAKHLREHLRNYYAREYLGISEAPYYSMNSASG